MEGVLPCEDLEEEKEVGCFPLALDGVFREKMEKRNNGGGERRVI